MSSKIWGALAFSTVRTQVEELWLERQKKNRSLYVGLGYIDYTLWRRGGGFSGRKGCKCSNSVKGTIYIDLTQSLKEPGSEQGQLSEWLLPGQMVITVHLGSWKDLGLLKPEFLINTKIMGTETKLPGLLPQLHTYTQYHKLGQKKNSNIQPFIMQLCLCGKSWSKLLKEGTSHIFPKYAYHFKANIFHYHVP